MQKELFSELTEEIIGCFYRVYNTLGSGFLEKVYENSLAVELAENGIVAQQQVPIHVSYKDVPVGQYVCDLLVENKVIVEVKAVRIMRPEHEAQILNYLKATGVEIGLLLNFGQKPEVRRRLFTKDKES
jgi:GxxExxY protein